VEGHSAIENEIALLSADPFVAVWLETRQDRTPRVVLEANTDHWNRERGPRLERVVFRNDLTHEEALRLVCETEGEVDIVTEVSPADAKRVEDSRYARLVTTDAMRVLVGIINRDSAPFGDVRARRALNMAANRERLIRDGLHGYAYPTAGLNPHYSAGCVPDLEPYPHAPDDARRLLQEAGYPAERPLVLAALPGMGGLAGLLADDYRAALGIQVVVAEIPEDGLLAAQHAFVEKVLPAQFDVLLFPWFDLTADAPAAFVHSSLYHSTGALRAGPPVAEFEELMGRYVQQTEPAELNRLDKELERLAYDQALSVFLCAPKALYAVNRHVSFVGHATTFEVAETEVGEGHWSRRGA
jgi:peptide/nickel transport system substrate-binding protein